MGAFLDAVNKMRASAAEAKARREAEAAALRERMRPYCRGYDVFPDEINSQYTSIVCRSLMKGLLIKSIFLAGLVTLIILGFVYRSGGMVAFMFLGFFIGLLLFFAALSDLFMLTSFISGEYDSFGAMVTHTRVESHTSTDEDGHTTTTYDYYVSLNGIECEVNSKEYHKVAVGQYLHFVRLRAKYRRGDRFYFFPCPVSEEQFIIGQHSPSRELRLYRPEKGSGALTALSVLCIIGSFGVGIYLVVTRREYNGDLTSMLFISGGLLAGGIVIAIINKCVGLAKGRKKLEEKRREYYGE